MTCGSSPPLPGSVSACVIARDAAATLGACLASIAWVDECVVVIDERSCDESEELARKAGARVIRHPYTGNVEQKNFALDCVKSTWVLALDADEALSHELAGRLRSWIEGESDGCVGVELNRVTRHLGRWLRHGDFYPDWQLRLFRQDSGRFSGANPHGRVGVEGPVCRVSGDLEHYSYADLADQIERVQSYSAEAARGLFAAGRSAQIRDLALRPLARFLRAYLLKRGFLDGIPGFVVAAVTAFHVFLKYAKLWELERGPAPQ